MSLPSDGRKDVDKSGVSVGLQVLQTEILRHLEREEENCGHRIAGDEYMDTIQEILHKRYSPDLMERECLRTFSVVLKVNITE